MSILQDPFNSGKRRVTYASQSANEVPQYDPSIINQSVEMVSWGAKDYSKYATETTGLPLTALFLLSVVSAFNGCSSSY